jgi:hypothetical protein
LYDLVHLFRMQFIFLSIYFLLLAPRGGFGGWFVTVGMVFWAAMGVGYFIGIVVPFSRAPAIGIVCAVCFTVTSGLFPSLNVVKGWNVLCVFWYLSYDRWAAEAFVILGASGQPTGGRMDDAIVAVGYDPGNFAIDIGLTFLIGVMWRVAAWIALLRSKPRTEF